MDFLWRRKKNKNEHWLIFTWIWTAWNCHQRALSFVHLWFVFVLSARLLPDGIHIRCRWRDKARRKTPPFLEETPFDLVFFSADFFYVSIMLTENEWWRNEDTNGTMLISHTIQMKDDQHRGTGFVVKIERERERERTYIRQMDKW